ncbi:MAG: hypothetical protein AB7O73_11270 [Bacteroidia bacterium]
MLKKHLILSLLLFAYTIVLGHSIIPHHHHHDDDHETEQTAHHHGHDHDDKDEDSDFSYGFENYFHSGTTADIHQQTNTIDVISLAVISTHLVVSNFELKLVELPPPLKRANNDFFQRLYYYHSSSGFRAPPFDLV